MSHDAEGADLWSDDTAPGDESAELSIAHAVRGYALGLFLAALMTGATFWAANTHLIYGPAIPVAIAALAVGQMGSHLVFFLHMTTAPDNANNALALGFGVLICGIIVFGSVWIMAHLNHNLMPMSRLLEMQR